MLVVGFPTGGFQANCYLVAVSGGADCVIIDPGQDATGQITVALREHSLTPAAVLATHGHFDHVASAASVADAHDLPLRIHPADMELLEDRPSLVELENGAVELAGLTIGVEHTPGHTPGSVIFRFDTAEGGRLVVTGDTLFAGSIGRTDRRGGSIQEITQSLRTKLLTLPDDTVVLPGHGPSTTIGQERVANRFLTGVR